jgi:phosphoglycerol transferase MdoB-like AlkP superfamily enzyme
MNNLKYFLKLFLFWLIYFLVNRLFFIANYFEEFSSVSTDELLRILPKSFGLDVSFIAYLSGIITIVLFFNSLLAAKRFNVFISGIIFWINAFFIVVSALIIAGEIGLYAEWGTKLNFTALRHFENPKEVFSTATFFNYFILVISIIIAILFVKFYTVFVHQNFVTKRYNIKQFFFKIIRFPFVLGVLLLLLRGGFQPIPINLSDAYFSKTIIVNDVTVNPNWNLGQSILKNKTNFDGNPYKKHSQEKVDEFIKIINQENDSSTYVLNSKNPNIVFILLESWSADNIESLGGLNGITPYFKALEKEGLLFTNFYSNGWTSDQAMSSIFSSFPVFPYVSIINQTDKARKLPCLTKSLIKNGYHSSFFFGGQLTYGNIKGYLLSQGFDIVKDENQYKHLPSGRLGVHDEYMFDQFKKELNSLPQPFMSTLFTISSHSPFDFPGVHTLSFNSKEDKYVNSVAYTDKCLGDFIASVKNDDWYANTLFVILADHSHNSPRNWRVAQKERFKIPMLWFGEVLKPNYKGSKWDKLSSHIDITPTILEQLGQDNTSYKFGRNILNKQRQVFVPYVFHRGHGLISNQGYYAFSEDYNKVFELEASDSTQMKLIKEQTEMYFQVAFEDYLSY